MCLANGYCINARPSRLSSARLPLPVSLMAVEPPTTSEVFGEDTWRLLVQTIIFLRPEVLAFSHWVLGSDSKWRCIQSRQQLPPSACRR